jgi:uncharacterized protein with HEPN domain
MTRSMHSDRTSAALYDIRHNIALAKSFVAELSLEEFRSDVRTVYAVTRCLEIISEATRRLPTSLKERHPQIPWQKVAGAGSVYRHGYDDVVDRRVWGTVHQSLEPLLQVVEQELAQSKEP